MKKPLDPKQLIVAQLLERAESAARAARIDIGLGAQELLADVARQGASLMQKEGRLAEDPSTGRLLDNWDSLIDASLRAAKESRRTRLASADVQAALKSLCPIWPFC